MAYKTVSAATQVTADLTQSAATPSNGAGNVAVSAAVGVRKSLFLSFADKHLRLVLQIASTLILARFLTPEEFGVFTIGLVVVYVADTLRDFGVATFIVQEKDLTPSVVRTAYGISLALGAASAAVIVLASVPLARFYHSPGVRDVLLVLSPMFLMTPFSSVVAAMLRRDMKFGTLLRINGITSLANNGIAIVLAVCGFGFMSLAWSRIAGAAVNYIVSHMVKPSEMSHFPSFREWRKVASFGVIMTGATVVGDLGARAPDLLIGRFLGITSVGLFGRGVTLIRLFDASVTNTITPVAVSSFAMHHRSGQRFGDRFLIGVSMTTAIAWPFFMFVALMAYPTTRILFGPQWDASVPITRLLCIAAAITSATNLNMLALQGVGAVRPQLASQWIIQGSSIALTLVACQFSLYAVGFVAIITACITVIVLCRFTLPVIHVTPLALLRSMVKSLIVTAVSSIVPVLVLALMTIDTNHIWLPFITAGTGTGAGFIAAAWGVRHPVWEEVVNMLWHVYGRLGVSVARRA